jgi:hypothetical protein
MIKGNMASCISERFRYPLVDLLKHETSTVYTTLREWVGGVYRSVKGRYKLTFE